MKTVKIAINGIVQGVGFRPFIARLAQKLNILGCVRNSSGTVIVVAMAEDDALNDFVRLIKTENPVGSFISDISINELDMGNFSDFTIIQSEENRSDEIILPADIAVCDDCLSELFDKSNPRFRYPFISCVSCGARYSIIKAVPYDRERTTMDCFDMCDFCAKEYRDDARRCYAQTISCNNCGPQLLLNFYDGQFNLTIKGETAFQKAVDIIRWGRILAVKSIGGYNYVCRADCEKAVKDLRLLKGRENKAFAVMFADIYEVNKYCFVSKEEESLLKSAERPIVLLERRNVSFSDEVCRGSRFIGAFLPYTPLHHLLLKEFSSLVITSANTSDLPIIFDDDEMLEVKSEFLCGVLYNEREIVTPLDDSVARVVCSDTQLIRRSRGYVPLPIELKTENKINILAVGGDLKASFCLLKNDKAYMSQYFGDLQSFEVNETYSKAYRHMSRLFNIEPDVVVVDKHPNYNSRAFGESLGLEVIEVQHHFAHICSVMAENALDDVIGVAFDGTGYGDDGAIWGGEFFVVNGCSYKRAGHIDYVKLCGGDLAAKDASMAECCYLYAIGYGEMISDKRFTTIKSAIDNNVNTNLTSSMGRLFDVISSILGVKSFNNYEGECAILLENCAYNAINAGSSAYPLSFDITENDDSISISINNLIKEIIDAKGRNVCVDELALGFHYAVADMIFKACSLIREKDLISKVALSGGVFSNKILLERAVCLLARNGFEVYFNKAVPTNDGGIALGQGFYAAKCANRI